MMSPPLLLVVKATVRLLVTVLTWCHPDNHIMIVALIKFDHAIAGLYMYAHTPTQESAHQCELTTSVGKLCLLQALNWTS